MFTEKDWEGSHYLKIRQTAGIASSKLYSTNYVDTSAFTIVVTNPCKTSDFTIPNLAKSPTVHNLVARQYNDQVTLQYEMPYDSASATYGPNVGVDKYSLCGERIHYLTIDERRYGIQYSGQRFRSA